MSKLKLKKMSNIGDVLTSEELKQVYGGMGSEEDFGSGSEFGSSKQCCCHLDLEDGQSVKITLFVFDNISCGTACSKMCITMASAYNPCVGSHSC